MNMLSNDYIVGLVDGEGSFTVQIRPVLKNKKTQRRAIVEPKFYIKLSEKDTKILFTLKKYLKCGNVYYNERESEMKIYFHFVRAKL
jgi:hypothetical protein